MSSQPLIALGTSIALALLCILLFWPEITRLKLVAKKGDQAEPSSWLVYLFGIATVGVVLLGFWQAYLAYTSHPAVLTAVEFSQPYLEGRFLKIADLADDQNVIEGRTFINCHIFGPAVLYPSPEGFGTIAYNKFITSSPQMTFQVMEFKGPGTGVIEIQNSTFTKCVFHNVTIVGTKETVDRLRLRH